MVESNYPVEKMGIGMPALWNMFKRLTAGASAAEKKAIFSGTANRVYRLGLVDPAADRADLFLSRSDCSLTLGMKTEVV